MRRVGEILRKNVPTNVEVDEFPYRAEMEAYDRKFFEENPDQNVPFPADPEGNYKSKPIPTEDLADTLPMPAGNEEMDAVNRARNPKEAIREYKNRYPLKEVDAGKKSPQLGAEMLLGIDAKFDETMTPKEKRDVALGKIEMAKRIIEMADKPREKSPEWVSIKGAMEIIAAISDARIYAPSELEFLMQGLRRVSDQLELRAPTISGPIMIALDESDKNPDMPFEKIHEEIEYDLLNQSNVEWELRDKEIKEQKAKEQAEQERQAREVGAEVIAQVIEKPSEQTGTGLYVVPNTGTAVASLKDLEAEDDETKLVRAA